MLLGGCAGADPEPAVPALMRLTVGPDGSGESAAFTNNPFKVGGALVTPRAYRQVLAEAARDFAPLVPPTGGGPVRVTIHGDRRAWAEDAAGRAGAATYLQIDRGGFEEDGEAVLYYVGSHDTPRLARHEAFHAWVSVHGGGTRPPAFVEEGLAARLETSGGTDARRVRLLREAGPGELPALLGQSAGELVADPAAAQLWYARAWAFGDYVLADGLYPLAGQDWSPARHAAGYTAHVRELTR